MSNFKVQMSNQYQMTKCLNVKCLDVGFNL